MALLVTHIGLSFLIPIVLSDIYSPLARRNNRRLETEKAASDELHRHIHDFFEHVAQGEVV